VLMREEPLGRGAVVQYAAPARVQATVRRIAPRADLRLPWLKEVGAVQGDEVCWEPETLRINGAVVGLFPLRQAYPLPHDTGCAMLGPDEVLPLGTAARSFDGRYTGTLHRKEIQSVCVRLL
jgi:type IV secretory pathway protease TraF